MVTKCSAPNCTERTSKKTSVSFHHFPSSIYRTRKWLLILKLKNNFRTSSALVCSQHFSLNQYKENGLLKNNAVPDQNLPKKEKVAAKPRRSPKNREAIATNATFVDIDEFLPDNTTDDSEDPLDVPEEPSLSVGECSYTYRPKAEDREAV